MEKEEVGRGCFEEKSGGGKQAFRVINISNRLSCKDSRFLLED